MTTSRKLGFLEKITILFHEQMDSSTSVAAKVKINTIIDFERFKKACHILFDNKPTLRCTLEHKDKKDYYFNFNAQFKNIPIKHIKTNDFNDVMQEYGSDIVKPFELTSYFWRATLVTMEQSETSYIIFGAPHTICDGKSVSNLLGDLIRIIQDLDNDKLPDIQSDPIPEPLDIILDRTKFDGNKGPYEPSTELFFENKESIYNIKSANTLKEVPANDFSKLLDECRKYNVTITSALCAALTKSIVEVNNVNFLDLSIAFNMRPYTYNKVSNQELAFYAHQLTFNVDLDINNFWDLAKQTKNNYNDAISNYVLESADNYELFDNISTTLKNIPENGKFFIPYTISNVGEVDSAFSGLNDKYKAHDFIFTVRNQGLFGFIIFASTLNGKLSLGFNYANPVLSTDTANKLIDGVMNHLRIN